MASSNVIVIICGTFFGGKSPGMVVPSSEQKQSGRTQTAGSHGGARFGSLSMSVRENCSNVNIVFVVSISFSSIGWNYYWPNHTKYHITQCLPHEFSSEPSAQSFSPLQKRPRSTQLPSPHAKNPSWHNGSSVTRSGFTLRSLFFSLQFLTASFQSHVCFSISK